jgi:hypothetical protein
MFYAVLNWKRTQFSESARFAWILEKNMVYVLVLFQFDNLIVGAKSIPKIVNSNVQIVVLQSEFFSVYVKIC